MSTLDDLTDAQREAVTHVEGPLLVVAGAGSGKTRVITRRVAYLIEQGVSPYNILAITFTNKAAGEMKERVAQLHPTRGMWISTFHSMAARILRRHADRLGYTSSFSIYDTADQAACVKQVMAAQEIDTTSWRPSALAAHIGRFKNDFVTPDEAEASASSFADKLTAQVYAGYQERLRGNNAMDFDDLLGNLAHLLADHDDLLEVYQGNFRFILVDEYQDTNHAQYILTRLLAQRHRNICATGDPDQSIYAWRGADIRNILDFEEDYPDAKVVLLEQNYRSTQNILAAADSVIEHNVHRKPKRLWTENAVGGPIRQCKLPNETGEADYVAQTIADMVEAGRKRGDVALFYRVNAQSRALEESLRRATIAYTIVGAVEFYQRKEIKDILAYLRLCANPADNVSFERIVNVPARGLGRAALDKIKAAADRAGMSCLQAGRSPEVVAQLSTRAAKGMAGFCALLDEAAGLPQSSVAEIVRTIIDKSRYAAYLVKREGELAADRIENVQELASAAAEYDERTEEGSLMGWLEEVALVSDVDDLDESTDVVHLMTLHSCKGLEFPVVFITGVEEGLLPHQRSIDSLDDREMEEERRLCYVGMTRAKQELVLTHGEQRTVFGRTNYCIPSRFLGEIPDGLKAIERSEELIYDLDYGDDEDEDDGEEREYQLDDMGG